MRFRPSRLSEATYLLPEFCTQKEKAGRMNTNKNVSQEIVSDPTPLLFDSTILLECIIISIIKLRGFIKNYLKL